MYLYQYIETKLAPPPAGAASIAAHCSARGCRPPLARCSQPLRDHGELDGLPAAARPWGTPSAVSPPRAPRPCSNFATLGTLTPYLFSFICPYLFLRGGARGNVASFNFNVKLKRHKTFDATDARARSIQKLDSKDCLESLRRVTLLHGLRVFLDDTATW